MPPLSTIINILSSLCRRDSHNLLSKNLEKRNAIPDKYSYFSICVVANLVLLCVYSPDLTTVVLTLKAVTVAPEPTSDLHLDIIILLSGGKYPLL